MRIMRTSAALLLLLAAGGCTGQDAADPPAATSASSTAVTSDTDLQTLRRVTWQFQEFTVAGQTTDVRAAHDTLRFDGRRLFVEGCNSMSADVDMAADGRTRVTDLAGSEVGCDATGSAAERALWDIDDGWSDWRVDGEQLEITFADSTLRYAAQDTVNPVSPGRLITELTANGMIYRLSLTEGTDGLGLALETSYAPPWLLSWVVADARPLTALVSAQLRPYTEQADPTRAGFVAGFVPASAVRVTHRADSDQAVVELAVVDIGDPELAVAVGFDTFHYRGSSLTAYDSAGDVVASWP